MRKLSIIKSKIRRKYFYRHYIRPLYQKLYGTENLAIRRQIFQQNGRELLQQFNAAMKEAGCSYWLEYGTLLGAIRDHGFMPHDFDLDVCIYQKDYNEKVRRTLEKYKFKKVRRISSPKYNVIEDTYSYKGVTIDIVLAITDEERDLMFNCAFSEIYSPSLLADLKNRENYCVHKCYFPPLTLIEFDFLGLQTYIPNNYNEHLSMIYGNDFMIPNPYWTSEHSTGIEIVYDKDIILIEDFV